MDGPRQPKDIEVVVWQGQRGVGMLGCICLGSVLLPSKFELRFSSKFA